MKLKLKNTPEQVELIKAMGSKNQTEAREANEAFAAFVGPVIQEVLNHAGTASAVYTDAPYDEDDSPSFPLDLYYNASDNHVSVWSQNMAGGLPSSHVEGMNELKIATYRLDSAVSFLKKYARRGRLDIVSKAVERMAQEVLVKQERNAWAVILKALAEASTGSEDHLVAAGTAGQFGVADLSTLMTRIKRINQSFAGGTPENAYSNGITDLYVSPEVKAEIRGFAYQPMNTRTVDGSTGTPAGSSTALPLPDAVREEIYRNAGSQEIFGVNIVEMNEFGKSQKYNTLFDEFDSGNISPDGGTFATAGEEVAVGIDNSRGAFIRPVAQQSDSGSTFVALADDQYTSRQEKMGFYGSLEEGRVCIDARAVCGIII
jgi:hypothetical protein